ncbi:MAG TPA: 4Fe-4S binding protein [Archangium sp.]|nr:4Fe-4S binding protein [Archangium sp.]
MSSQAAISRRALLGFLRKREEPAPSSVQGPAAPVSSPEPPAEEGFSLEAFYSARSRSGEVTGQSLPVFSLREGLVVPQDSVSRIGKGGAVRVRPQLCLAWQGSFCSTCSERCPVEDAIVIELGRPRVLDARCNGCGLCVQVCPAPLNAFEFLPSP